MLREFQGERSTPELCSKNLLGKIHKTWLQEVFVFQIVPPLAVLHVATIAWLPPPLHRHNTVFLNPGLGVVIRGGFTKKGAQTTSQQLTRGKTSITKIQLPPLQKKTKHNTHQQISSISDGFKKKKACTWFLFFFFLVCRAVVQKRKHRQLLVLFRKRRGLKLNTPK